ncbi:BnaA07g04080D [Brassica napus]|uniref:BnaA07g04080D protein n=2 Tax=Brassica napus TaxID=3708 RepID=A0A078HGW9_BRANA|nr:BnaA07g04080D [Brassica napus]
MHYTENRAVSEELKRKTFLPYKQGWLAGANVERCLGFNPAVHEISRVGSLSRAASS